MFMPGKEPLDSVEPPSSQTPGANGSPVPGVDLHRSSPASGLNGSAQPVNASHDALLSPSIQRVFGEQMAAFEVKFLITDEAALKVEDWAGSAMQRDAYADLSKGGYQTTTLYLDTPNRDVFHRSPGFRKHKFRLRRYGSEQRLYLERKTRQGDRVAKRRCDVPLAELTTLTCDPAGVCATWPGIWFREQVIAHPLQPSCRLTYDRSAFVKGTEDGPLRLTLDRRIRGIAASEWDMTPLEEGNLIIPGHVICEFKFRGSMPNLFKEVIRDLQLEAGSVSKYRRMMLASGAVANVIIGDASNEGGINA